MHSTSPKRIPRLAQLRMKIAPSGPVSNSSVCRTFSACDTSLRPKPKLEHSSASPEMTFAPASTTLENSDTANKVLLTYVSLTSSVKFRDERIDGLEGRRWTAGCGHLGRLSMRASTILGPPVRHNRGHRTRQSAQRHPRPA